MMLVYSGRLFHARDTRYAQLRHREMIPIGICDFIGTMGTTIGLEFAGSAIFGIIFSSVTVRRLLRPVARPHCRHAPAARLLRMPWC
jgi:hypothetical protein